jgi:2-octaprenyl-6-methoxyphenol hydroxylase
MSIDPLRIAVVGAGPVGLALALMAAQRLPRARITLFDARALERDVRTDARTLALSLGSVQMLQRLQVWPSAAAQPITQVHVSQVPPTLDAGALTPEVLLDAHEEAVPMLGAVLSYGALVAPLQTAWLALAATQPQRLRTAFGQAVGGVQTQGAQGGAARLPANGLGRPGGAGQRHAGPRHRALHAPGAVGLVALACE